MEKREEGRKGGGEAIKSIVSVKTKLALSNEQLLVSTSM